MTSSHRTIEIANSEADLLSGVDGSTSNMCDEESGPYIIEQTPDGGEMSLKH